MQFTFLAAYLIVVSTWLWLGRGSSIQPLGEKGLVSAGGMILWWASPALVLLFLRTSAGAVVTGAALLLAGSVALASIYIASSSTAGIGLYVLPPVLWMIALASVATEWIFRRPWTL